jgi:hypothetical protein
MMYWNPWVGGAGIVVIAVTIVCPVFGCSDKATIFWLELMLTCCPATAPAGIVSVPVARFVLAGVIT